MHLIIDVGNTFRKIAVFDNTTMLAKEVCDATNFSDIFSKLITAYPQISKGILSSVGDFTSSELKLVSNIPFITLNYKTPVPFINKYLTPKTLGVDRIALVSAAAKVFPKKNTLVIDAGSCITIDFISNKNEYFGGTITPGIAMRYKAMHHFTSNLPLLKTQSPTYFIGNSTETSMHLGAFSGTVYEIQGAIATYKNKYPDLRVILTGGDTHLLRDSLKNDIFANSNFLLEGLNFILQHNTHK